MSEDKLNYITISNSELRPTFSMKPANRGYFLHNLSLKYQLNTLCYKIDIDFSPELGKYAFQNWSCNDTEIIWIRDLLDKWEPQIFCKRDVPVKGASYYLI
jgi:hypothetical protein